MRRRVTHAALVTALCLTALACSDGMPEAPPGGPALVASRCEPPGPADVDCAGGPRRSPFACLRFDGDCNVDVRVEDDGPWYRLEGINGVTLAGILAVADTACAPPDLPSTSPLAPWKRKRLAEDLPALMDGACAPLGETADLALRDHDSGAWVTKSDVPVTEAKRSAARLCWPRHDECGG
jgi:hypothetical protein